MNVQLFAWLLVPIIVALMIPLWLLVVNGAAFRQKPDQVVIRKPGERFLGTPHAVAEEAIKDLDFALLSQAAYQRKPDAKQIRDGACVDADSLLQARGWELWKEFPSQDLQREFAKVHLRVEVWSNAGSKNVAVTFGGTVFENWQDWKANLRWFIFNRNDEYTAVVKTFGKKFVEEYEQASSKRPFLRQAALYATGHSLGGGLAQEFAYSLPKSDTVGPVKKVYAFDTSPVTGFSSVAEDLRNYNKKNLAIDRIYERGEILAILRSFTNFFVPPAATEPTIRQVRYNLFPTRNVITGHSIAKLACKLYVVCGEACFPSSPAPEAADK